jgi:Nuclease-related domain/UvrD-like helicase C-terminal domain/AAA domain
MARLIPSFMDDCTPPGERDVFNMLAAGPDEWVALHSLDLAPWNRGLRTEIDFVVIVPETGILCIEVKSHENITFEKDRWHPSTIKRSPFKQASDGRHTFYRRLRELAPQFKNVPVIHCCIFPRSLFELTPNLSIHPWELMDNRAFRVFDSGDNFCADLRARMQSSIEADGNLTALAARLAQDQIEAIANLCLPVRRRRPDARDEILRREEQIGSMLRKQQKPVLQLAALNDRLVVFGGAGTGKTLIAMEVARRAAEKGRRVALLCFNQMVGEWMRERMSQLIPPVPNLVVGRAIRVMAEMTGVKIPDKPSHQFWEVELAQLIEDRLTDPDFKAEASFDYLVLDEAQDLLARPLLWQCLIQFLAGSVETGAFALFGDFENQVLTERHMMNQTLASLEGFARPSRWRLSENCRNYRIVGDTALRLSGFRNEVYSGYMRIGGGVHNYDIYFYEHERAQLDQLARWLKEFKSEGYKPSEITILSFRSTDACAATQLKNEGFKLRPAWRAGEFTGYASVHSFKGMESKVVILTDLVLGELASHRHIFYTGMTRATESVRVLCDMNSKEALLGWIVGKG